MQLVKANSKHIPIIISLAKKIWPVAYGEILSKAQLDYMIQKFYNETALLESLAKGHVFYLAQNEQEKFVGFVSYEINCEPNKTKIHKIYVLPETQGSGVGKQLFEFVKTKALQVQQTAIFLNVNKYNKAIYFYTNLGFKIIKEEVIDIGNNYIMDDYVMEVNL